MRSPGKSIGLNMSCMKCVGMSKVSKQTNSRGEKMSFSEDRLEEPSEVVNAEITEAVQVSQQTNGEKTLKDAVKPKNKRKKKQLSGTS